MKYLFRPFPLPLTWKQWCYLGFLQGVGAGFIDGGANFAIAYAMYHSQDVVKVSQLLYGVLMADCFASMLITSTLVHTDLHHHAISPLPFVYPHVEDLPDPRWLFTRRGIPHETDEKPQPGDGDGEYGAASAPVRPHKPGQAQAHESAPYERNLEYYFWMLVRFTFEGTEKNMLLQRIPVWHWFGRLAWTAAQGAAIGIVFGFPIWCLAIVILGPIYGNGNMGNKWAPQVIKLVYGAIVGWVTNPVIAVLALGSQATHHLVVVEVDAEVAAAEDAEAQIEGVASRGHPETIREDEEYLAPPSPRAPSQVPSSPSRSTRLAGPSTPTRTRSASVGSYLGRPPLTANVTSFVHPVSPVISTHSVSQGLIAGVPTPGRSRSGTVPSVGPTRPRGATVTSQTPSERSFSYALGGTGGRAKRSRGLSSASVGATEGLPPLSLPALSTSTSEREGRDATRTAVWDVFGRTEVSPPVRRETTGAHQELGRPVAES